MEYRVEGPANLSELDSIDDLSFVTSDGVKVETLAITDPETGKTYNVSLSALVYGPGLNYLMLVCLEDPSKAVFMRVEDDGSLVWPSHEEMRMLAKFVVDEILIH